MAKEQTLFSRARYQFPDNLQVWIGGLDALEQLQAHVLQYWAWRILEHNHADLVYSTLKTRYKHAWKDIEVFVDPIWNPLRKVAGIKAQAYSRPPTRTATDTRLATVIARSTHTLNTSLATAEEILNGCGNVLIWPVIQVAGDEINLELLAIEPHSVYLEPNYTDHRYDVIAKYTEFYLGSSWSGGARRNYCLGKNGQEVKRFASMGSPIWCSLARGKFGQPRTVGKIRDLVRGTLTVGVLEAFAEKVSYLKSFRQPVEADSQGPKVNPERLAAGPENVWPAAVDLIDLADKTDFFESLIERRVMQLAGQHGISKMVMSGDYHDGQTWASVNQELTGHFEKQIENWHQIERELWRSVCSMDLINLDPETRVSVVFIPPYPGARDPLQEWALHREKVKAGVAKTTDWIRQEHPEMDLEQEAVDFYMECLALYAQEVTVKRALNIQDEGPSPEQNGAGGGEYDQKQNARYGKIGRNGPSVEGGQNAVDVERMKQEGGEK